MRARRFREDVRRAGIAQEQRARSAASSTRPSTIPSRSGFSGRTSDEPSYAPPYVWPPGSMKPRRTHLAFRHPIHYGSRDRSTALPDAPPLLGARTNGFSSFYATPKDSCVASPAFLNQKTPEPAAQELAPEPRVKVVRAARPRSSPPVDPRYSIQPIMTRPFLEYGPDAGFSSARYHPEVETSNMFPLPGDEDLDDAHLAPTLEDSEEVRVEWKLRTRPSTTIDETGCIIQKGWVTPTRSSRNTTPQSSRAVSRTATPQRSTGTSHNTTPMHSKSPSPVIPRSAAMSSSLLTRGLHMLPETPTKPPAPKTCAPQITWADMPNTRITASADSAVIVDGAAEAETAAQTKPVTRAPQPVRSILKNRNVSAPAGGRLNNRGRGRADLAVKY
ncbi:hypothetical protein BAUCODRAFT_205053 [Baudoinia panamericana UAMH 10762]|uniref:Uncharacterized protein n=1 Tax=Baudoinia panamericana (strain UAMH 10762) TaxID=717646 RepID=M2MWC5_BAUPA|nr:uncharacterized protein BAUCODRAFT_205053 [Baudoinia panamericana UAMH 10762]EMD01297.1 hypothetical protein BAUCODRAFT_205053 [Baudoinia panamericana UAMH 10762]